MCCNVTFDIYIREQWANDADLLLFYAFDFAPPPLIVMKQQSLGGEKKFQIAPTAVTLGKIIKSMPNPEHICDLVFAGMGTIPWQS